MTAISTASHRGSTPRCSMMGASTGTIMKVISIKSRKQPARKIIPITTLRMPHLPKGRPRIRSRTWASPFKPRNTSPRVVAPTRIMKTMQVRLVVPFMTSIRVFRLSFPCMAVRSVAPTAPTAAASVGEAIPAKIDPNTAIIRNKGGIRAFITLLRISALEMLSRYSWGIGGAHSGLTVAIMDM